MKKLVVVAVTAMALVAAAPASAEPGKDQGCGDIFRGLGAPGFGQAVSEVAGETGFDDYVQVVCRHF
ncbi:MAG TPA: hypothetical protein VF517_12680 [Thermoleophilaceae bacterium]|jgi:hypothetical protein